MKKRVLSILLAVLMIATVFALSSCDDPIDPPTDENEEAYRAVYELYVEYAENNGEAPQDYEEWLDSIRGEDGKDGKPGKDGADGKDGVDGKDGLTPAIGENGNWWIGDVDTGVPVFPKNGQDGADGADGKDGVGIEKIEKISTEGLVDTYEITYTTGTKFTFTVTNGKDGVNGEDGKDGVDGEDGKDGITPLLRITDGYWEVSYDNGATWTSLGVKATGEQGPQGEKGETGEQGPQGDPGKDGQDGTTPTIEISEDGYWIINGIKSDVKAEATDGDKGDKGDTGATIEKVEFDEEGRLVITLTDGTVLDPIELPKKEEHVHTFGNWINYAGNANVYCENRLFYHICSECKVLEWKSGSYEDHDFSTTTVAPTCTAGGYDKKTCSICGYFEKFNFTDRIDHDYDIVTTSPTCVSQGFDEKKCSACGHYVKTNYTDITGHTWKEDYVFDGSYHWQECMYCDAKTNKIEHNLNDDSICITCGKHNGLEYTLSEDETYYIVSGIGTCTDEEVVIATSYKGLPVKKIADKAFSECTDITSILISNTITHIGNRAFYGCTGLTEITIPKSVIDIGTQIFYKANNLHTVYYNSTYTGGTYSNSNYTNTNPFLNVSHIKKVVFGGEYVPPCILYDNGAVTEIVIQGNVNYIGVYAFYSCESLDTATITADIEYIDGCAFSYCTSLKSVNIKCDTLSSIRYNAFSNCNSLKEFSIPDSVTNIGQNAFYSCLELSKVNFGLNVRTVGAGAFSYCRNLKTITIPNIEMYCQMEFEKDKNESYGYYTNPVWAGAELYIDDLLVTDIIIPSTVTSISESAFRNYKHLKSLTIMDGVTHIGASAFSGCSNLSNIIIPDSVTTIGNSAFSSCTSLQSITIPDSVTSMVYAFYNCHNLMSVVFPSGISSAYGAFSGCYRLVEVITDLDIPVGSSDYGEVALHAIEVHSSRESKLTRNGNYVFYTYNSINYMVNYLGDDTLLELPEYYNDQKYVIYDYAFAGCNTLENVIIPNTIKSLPRYAFYYCEFIDYVYIPNSVISISDTTFYGTNSFQIVLYCEVSEESSSFKDYIKDYYVVWDCKNNDIASDGYIHIVIEGVYYGLKNGTANVLSSQTDETYFNIQDKIIYNSISYTVTRIGKNAFYVESGEEILIVPNTIKYIEGRAFRVFNGGHFNIFYIGTQEEWNSINVDFLNDSYYRYYYSEDAPTTIGAFWHYVDDVPTIWPEYVAPIYSEGLEYTSNGDGTCYVSGIGTCTDTILYIPPTSPSGDTVKSLGAEPSHIIDASSSPIFAGAGITEVHIPYSVEYIHPTVWIDAKEINNIVVHENNPNYKSIDGNLYSKDGSEIVKYAPAKEDTEFTISENVIEIGKYAFLYCENITGVIFVDAYDWYFSDNDILISGYIFTHSELSDPANAATYLKSTYCHCWLKKN